jgi:hypothetical protein
MTDASLANVVAENDFRVGRVLNRTAAVLGRHFPIYFIIIVVASLPSIVLVKGDLSQFSPQDVGSIVIGGLLAMVLGVLGQAAVLHAAFQDMRGRPVNITESVVVGLRRFFPLIGLAIVMGVLVGLGAVLLIVPGMILWTMWIVSTPVCVVERLGPWSSLRRSAQLTKGYRWRVFGLMIVLFLVNAMVAGVLANILQTIGGTVLTIVGRTVWAGLWGSFFAVAFVVTYHDLRAAKEGVDINQIAAVFD